jgi:hypothetical protein
MVITVKNGEFFRVYLNGELWLENTLLPVDGRWALVNELLLFADDDGDDATINCAETAIWDVALSPSEVLQLGGFAGNVLVSGITVTAAGNASTIETAGGTLQMSAAILPVNATDQTVTWSVTKGTGDASITTDGLLTAIKNGTVTVNATSKDGGNVIGSMVITISNQALIAVTGITVTSAGGVNIIDINGGTLQMSAAVLPVDATDQSVTWSVTNVTGSATITAEGLLAALTDGTVLVEATSNDAGHVVGSLEITISNQGKVRERKGWWKFDDAADMLKAEIGLPLALTGTQTSISGPATGNLATRVPLGSYLTMTHGIDPNGGGALVNEWTLQIDFSVPEIPLWYAFFQTADGDADLFIAKTENSDINRVPNSIGTGSVSYTANTVAANTWYRMVVSVKNGEFFRIYINGELWLDSPSVQAVDGRYGLAPTLLLFQDDDGDDGTIYCSETAIWNVALTAAEALELGSIPMNVSIRENKANSVKLYPNPAENDLYISGKPNLSKVAVYTVLGTQVKEYSNVLQSINVSDLKTGIYIIRLTDTNGKTVTSKFMKK